MSRDEKLLRKSAAQSAITERRMRNAGLDRGADKAGELKNKFLKKLKDIRGK